MEIYLRCKKCTSSLAGPLYLIEQPSKAELSFNACLEIESLKFNIEEYYDFYSESNSDLITHPQWYDCWHSEWIERSEGAYKRKMFISTKDAGYGCCGPIGKTSCSRCGTEIGRVYADCVGYQWMLFFYSKIERSDMVDGAWNIHTGNDGTSKYIENIGQLSSGLKTGEWEVWSNIINTRKEKYRNKEKKIVIGKQRT